MSLQQERRLLQWFTDGVVVVVVGLATLVFLTGIDAARWLFDIEFVAVERLAELDSSLRFFGAIFLSTGVILAWSIPRIERADPVVQIAAGGLVLGAGGRLISAVDEGWPNAVTTVLMILEASVIVVVVWQLRIKRLHSRAM